MGIAPKPIASHEDKQRLLPLSLAALGIVYGDIGTSPLYAFRESFLGGPALLPNEPHVFGVLSMIVWSLFIVITVKYLQVVMRANNQGEGGIVALVSLLDPKSAKPGTYRFVLVMTGLFGAALLYGDGTITPAISVLSALEGLSIVTTAFDPYIVPLTVVILIGLFMLQRQGTASIGTLFGPVMVVWFLVLGGLGVASIINQPRVLLALSPTWAFQFIFEDPSTAFLVLGAVFLAVTGGETLYADMGHFGARPIRYAWFAVVMPGVVLNYFGQGALVISNMDEIAHPFYHLAPEWALIPLVILSTIATIIASQAVISGVFSLSRQAINLGQLPRLKIIQTSHSEFGQIYIPSINYALMVATILLVVTFQSSENLASAYGVAISTDMIITTVLIIALAKHWRWNNWLIATMAIVFLPIDFAFWMSSLVKIPDGGWYPILVGVLVFGLMLIWNRGQKVSAKQLSKHRPSVLQLPQLLATPGLVRTPGTAVFLMRYDDGHLPAAFFHMINRLKSLPEKIVLLRVEILERPKVPSSERIDLEELEPGIHLLRAKFGFKETIFVPLVMLAASKIGLNVDPKNITYVVSTDVVIPEVGNASALLEGRNRLFRFMSRNADKDFRYFNIPADQTLEIGLNLKL